MPLTEQELGQRIRGAREACGLTQEQLGEPAGLGRVAIEQIEAGTRSVSSIELDRIAYAVGRDMKAFFAEPFDEKGALAAHFRSAGAMAGAPELRALRDRLARGREMKNLERLLRIDAAADFLIAPESAREQSSREDPRRRFLGLALEAYRREEITSSKFGELAAMVGMRRDDVQAVLSSGTLD